MRCEYSDGLKVDYAGALRITKGTEVNVFMKEGAIPATFKGDLDRAVISFNCSDLRTVAERVTDSVGNRACVHE